MTAELLAALVFIGFLALILGLAAVGRRWSAEFRPMAGFEALRLAIERAVEAGERVHVSLGTGSVIGPESAPALVGLAMLGRVAAATAMSDKPVVVTTGDGALAILAQDTLRTAYERAGAGGRYDPTSGRMVGPTPFSYVAGLPMVLSGEDVSVNMLNGSFGAESALAAEFGQRQNGHVLAGADDLQAQALLYVTAENPLLGEEVFAGGAYLNVGPLHRASLRAQDVARWVIVAAVILGSLLLTFGVGR